MYVSTLTPTLSLKGEGEFPTAQGECCKSQKISFPLWEGGFGNAVIDWTVSFKFEVLNLPQPLFVKEGRNNAFYDPSVEVDV